MAAVTCPLCGTRVDAGLTDHISESLKVHMVTRHDMANFRLFTVRPVCATGTTWISEGGIRETTAPSMVTTEVYPDDKPESGSVKEREALVGRHLAINCPFCERLVLGEDADDLGRALREHWEGSHQIGPMSEG